MYLPASFGFDYWLSLSTSIFKHFTFVANVSSFGRQGFVSSNDKGSFYKDPKYLKISFLGFANLLIAFSTLKICKFLPQKKVLYDFLKTKFSTLQFTKRKVAKRSKEKSLVGNCSPTESPLKRVPRKISFTAF